MRSLPTHRRQSTPAEGVSSLTKLIIAVTVALFLLLSLYAVLPSPTDASVESHDDPAAARKVAGEDEDKTDVAAQLEDIAEIEDELMEFAEELQEEQVALEERSEELDLREEMLEEETQLVEQ